MAHLRNRSNQYAAQLGNLFEEMPKSVLAAIAVSALTCGGDHLEFAKGRVAREWKALYDAGIVPQQPNKIGREAAELKDSTEAEF